MSQRMGFHWTPCNDGGGGGWIVALVVALIICGAIAKPAANAAHAVVRGADEFVRVVTEVVEIAAITVASAAGAAALGGIAWLVVRRRRRAAQQAVAATWQVTTVVPRAARRLAARTEASALQSAPVPAGLAAPKPQDIVLYLHGLSPDAIAALTGQLANGNGHYIAGQLLPPRVIDPASGRLTSKEDK